MEASRRCITDPVGGRQPTLGCLQLGLVQMPANVTHIGEHAFSCCNLPFLTPFPNNLVELCPYAFARASMPLVKCLGLKNRLKKGGMVSWFHPSFKEFCGEVGRQLFNVKYQLPTLAAYLPQDL